MKSKLLLFFLLSVLLLPPLVIFIVYLYLNGFPPATYSTATIWVLSPEKNAIVSAPLVIEGKALGSWFFEASFPITLLDENSQKLASTTAQTQNDWMTEGFVSFTATFETFDPNDSLTGILRFQKNNPSGLPENDASFDLPVRF